jgi:hypothetical protein
MFAGHSCQEAIDIAEEEAAVITVNEEEQDAYFDRDLSRLEAVWVLEPTSRRVFTTLKLVGWDQIRSNYEEAINNSEWWETTEDISASFSDYRVNMYDNTALIYHDIQWSGKRDGSLIDVKQERIVHLVKKNGSWKIDLIVQLSVPAEEEVREDIPESEDSE